MNRSAARWAGVSRPMMRFMVCADASVAARVAKSRRTITTANDLILSVTIISDTDPSICEQRGAPRHFAARGRRGRVHRDVATSRSDARLVLKLDGHRRDLPNAFAVLPD